VNADLHLFVREALARGVSSESIRTALREARWPDDEIEAALAGWHDAGLGLPVPRRRIGVSPREAYLHLLLFVSLYLVAYHTGAILFVWFDRMWPDPAFRDVADAGRDAVRFSLASLLVAFPVYLFTARVIGLSITRDPEKRNSGVRRWLTYLTLFVAACVLIGDLIGALLGLLRGALTQRFASKAAVVALIASWLFSHYLGRLQRDEDDVSHPAPPSWLARSAGLAVALVLALGLWFSGTPAQVRRQALDRRRIEDLQGLSDAVILFHTSNHRYPATLDEMHQWNPSRGPVRTQDPVSGRHYELQIADSTTFSLCATFDAPDSIGPFGAIADPFWRHEAGRACFTFHTPAPVK